MRLEDLFNLSAYQKARLEAKKGNLSGALSHLEASPQGARDLTISSKVQERLGALVPLPPVQECFPLELFGETPQWDQSKVLILTGRSGLGKTELARSLLPTAVFCREIEDIRGMTSESVGLIFDDMTFMGDPHTGKGEWPPEKQIHLCDWNHPSSIRLRYKNFTIPAHTPKIITSNKLAREVLDIHNEAIRRRSTAWLVFGDLGKLKYTVLY